jgi:predicted metal-binding membrane protein
VGGDDVAMMLPSLMPTLLRYHESLGKRVGTLWAALLVGTVGFSYFVIWAAVGAIVFPFGVALADAAMRQARVANAGPTAVAVVLIAAGVLHGSAWKERYLARCRDTSDAGVAARIDARAAWHYGLCLGRHCIRSCAGLTVVGLCLGLMDARVMAAIAIAVTAERLAPNGVRVARVVSVLVVVLGMSILVGAMALSHD